MQRVRIGLTGLASVFLLVLIAAAIFSMVGHKENSNESEMVQDAADAANGISSPDQKQVVPPKEPLAELGVTPGNSQPRYQAAEQAHRTGSDASDPNKLKDVP